MSIGLASRARIIVIACLLPAFAQAQIGSLANKIKSKVPSPGGSSTTTASTAPAPANDCVPCQAKNMAITPDLVGRLVTGLKAELAERDREEQLHANDGVGHLYAARDFVYHCDSLKAADSAYQVSLIMRMQKGDQAAIKEIQAWAAHQSDPTHQRCANNRAPNETDQAFFNMLSGVQAKQDTVGAKAGGFSVVDFAAAIELVSGYVLSYSPQSAASHYPPSAVDAMNARKPELAALLRREFNPSGVHKFSYEL